MRVGRAIQTIEGARGKSEEELRAVLLDARGTLGKSVSLRSAVARPSVIERAHSARDELVELAEKQRWPRLTFDLACHLLWREFGDDAAALPKPIDLEFAFYGTRLRCHGNLERARISQRELDQWVD